MKFKDFQELDVQVFDRDNTSLIAFYLNDDTSGDRIQAFCDLVIDMKLRAPVIVLNEKTRVETLTDEQLETIGLMRIPGWRNADVN